MILRISIVSCILLSSANAIFSQHNIIAVPVSVSAKVDSLLALLQKDNEDTNRIILSYKVANEYRLNSNYDSALYYGNAALQLATTLNFSKGIANASAALATTYYLQSNYSKALEYNSLSLKIHKEETQDSKGIATAYNLFGNIYSDQGYNDKAIENYFEALNIAEKINDKNSIAATYNNIAIIYNEQSDYKNALKNHFAALEIKKQIGDKRGLANSYNNIGLVLSKQAKHHPNPDSAKFLYEKAFEYYFSSLNINQEINDKDRIAGNYNSIGNAFADVGKYDLALKNYHAELNICEEIEDPHCKASTYNNIGLVYIDKGSYDDAIAYLQKGLQISKEIGTMSLMMDAYEGLSRSYVKKKDYKNGYEFHQLYSQYKDSILNEESGKQIAEMQTKYETEKKEKEIVLQKSELEKKGVEIKQQTTQKLAFAGGFGLMLLLALVVFRNYKQKQKANLLLSAQKQEIETKNTDLENANVVIKEKSELLHESLKDITDSITYGSYIQQAILPEQGLFNRLFPEAFILYKPRDIVSGDFYQVAEDDESVYLLTADCTGHGVPGAFMSILGATLFNDALHLKQPDLILAEMRNGIVKALKQNTEIGGRKEGMDCSLLRINHAKQILEIAAANNPVYVVRQGELLKIEPDSMPVGISDFGMKSYTLQKIPLQSGDMLYALTDGYVDQFGGPRGKKFKTGQLKPLLAEIADKPLAEQKVILEKTLDEWKGTNDQVDDISLMGLRV